MQAVILAGGGGTRLHAISDRSTKPMLPFFGRPVMEHSIRLLKKHGVKDILVALSYRAKEVMDYFGDGAKWRVKIAYSLEEKPMGTAGGVKRLQPAIRDTFVVMPADAITDFNLSAAVEFHRLSSAMATVLMDDSDDPWEYGVVATTRDGLVTKYAERPQREHVFSSQISTGIYVMEPEVLGAVPYDTPCDFGREVFPRLLRNMDPMYACQLPGYWCDVGDVIQYRNAHFDAMMGKLDVDIEGKEIEPGVHVAVGTTIHRSARINAPAFVGRGAEIRRNAVIGGLSVVGPDALIDEAAVVARSIIGSGAFIGRASKVSDCVIGSGYHLADNGLAHNRLMTEGYEDEFAFAEDEEELVPVRA